MQQQTWHIHIARPTHYIDSTYKYNHSTKADENEINENEPKTNLYLHLAVHWEKGMHHI